MSYYDPIEYSKQNINDFYIHGLSDNTYELKMPLPPHRQFTHSLLFVLEGSLIASSGFDDYTLNQNTMIFVPAGQVSSLSFMSEDIKGFYLHFTNSYLSQQEDLDFSEWLIKPILKFNKIETDHLLTLLNRMQQLNENDINSNLIKLYLATFLTEIRRSVDLRMKANFHAHERITVGFKKLLNFNITKHRSVSFYANELHISPNHLNRAVRLTLGRSASSLIDEMLILEARILMQKSNMTISEIAFEIGFDDASYFGRFFKKHTGIAPTDYRKTLELS